MTDNETTIVQQLVSQNEALQREHNQCQRNINQMALEQRLIKDQIKSNRQKLMLYCPHTWEMNTPQYQTPTSYTCNKCGNYK